MKLKYVVSVAVISVSLTGVIFAQDVLPKGWFKAGSQPSDYSVSVKSAQAQSPRAIEIKSIVSSPKGFGTLMQTILANHYRGRRVRFSGYMRAQGVERQASLWMRISDSAGGVLGFDNMKGRALQGSSKSWKKCEVVMDVPRQAAQISFGVLLDGGGTASARDLNFEIVKKNVAVTTRSRSLSYPKAPVNLRFE